MNQFLLFKLASYTFGTNADYLVEILNTIPIVDNQINLRNKVIPVINSHDFFEYDDISDSPKILVLDINNSTYALPISDVSDVISVSDRDIFNTPIIISSYNKYVKYIIKTNQGVFPVLNLEAII